MFNAVLPLALLALSQPGQEVSVDLDEALQLGLVKSYTIRAARIQKQQADAQVDGAWGNALPRVDLSASYTRNLKSVNPFAGTDVASLFGGAATGWLSYNEEARLDGDPNTNPISYDEYNRRVSEGMSAAGAQTDSSGNPFAVDNSFSAGISVTQILYSGTVFSGIRAAKVVEAAAAAGVDRQAQLVVQQVGQAYYGALLARAQVEVLDKSVARTEQSVAEARDRVQQGVSPQLSLLSSEVDLANYQTQRLRAEQAADNALDALKLALGLPGEVRLRVRGSLTATAASQLAPPSPTEAVGLAYTQRPDLRQLEHTIRGYELQESATRASYTPTLSAFFNIGYTGSVPDDRSTTVSAADDPFTFQRSERGFFSDDYWGMYANIGLSLSWNLFDGLSTSATLRQNELTTRATRLQRDQLKDSVRTEVERSLRALKSAREQLAVQDKNVARAELSYEHAKARTHEGVSTQLELRVASGQLDDSRLARLSAIYDLLLAELNYQVAVGTPITTERE